MDELIKPVKLWTRADVMDSDVVPRFPGVYACYFRKAPPGVPVKECHVHDGLPLLYVGVSMCRPPKARSWTNNQTLRNRLRFHMGGNAEGSTLRLTLGCLLSDRLGIELRRAGSGKRMTFGAGEARLDKMARSECPRVLGGE